MFGKKKKNVKKEFFGDFKIRELLKGEFVRLNGCAPVYVKGEYCRDVNKYVLYDTRDISHVRMISGDKIVKTGFTY